MVETTRSEARKAAHRPPINPRHEDPLAFLDLEPVDTFRFLRREDLPAVDEVRACFTIKVLDLNRDVLVSARHEACGTHRARPYAYRGLPDDGADDAELGSLRDAIETSAHPKVRREMRRQHAPIGELHELFRDVPEALTW